MSPVPGIQSGGARPFFPVLLPWLCCAMAFSAAATSPELKSISPAGAQRGTELSVRFEGERLQDAEEIIPYDPGIQVLKIETVTNKVVEARLKLLSDAPLGEHHFRVRTATGLSDLRTFFVGPFPTVDEVEPNNDPAHAQKVDLNTTIAGVIKNEDVDCFALELKKGQRLSAEVEGIRLGRGLFDPRLAVLGPAGSVLADVDDTWLAMQDPFITLAAPEDGTYVLRLREATYGGGEKCQYRLHIGSFPRPTSVFPLGGAAGQTLSFTFYSPVTGEFKQEFKLPDGADEKFPLFALVEGLTAPTPNWVRVCAFSNILATPGNHDREHATTTEQPPPLSLNGILSTNGQEDWYRFAANKGVPLELKVYARRLRSPLDSVLEVFDPAGHQLTANDDAAGPDSETKFTPAESTNYFVRIRDTLGQGGPDFGYRVEVTPVEPALTVKIPEVARNDTQSRQFIAVPRGNRVATLISAKRANFGGELAFGAPGLPAGVTLHADPMAKNIDAMPLVFEAAADAPLAGKLLDLVARGTNDGHEVVGRFHQHVELVQGPPNNASYYDTSVDKLAVAVTREAPFHLSIVEPKVPLVQGGSMRLEVRAERAPGFDEPIEVQMVWNPPGISSQSEITIAKGATNGFYQLNASGGAETRTWKIALLGHAKVDEGQLYVSTQLAPLEIATPYVSGKIETVWLNPGQAGKVTVDLQQLKPFEGKATIRLCGLPDKLSAADQEITKDTQQVDFEVKAEPNCANGSYRNLFCSVELKSNGEIVPHNIAQGGIVRVVPPRKKPEAQLASTRKK